MGGQEVFQEGVTGSGSDEGEDEIELRRHAVEEVLLGGALALLAAADQSRYERFALD